MSDTSPGLRAPAASACSCRSSRPRSPSPGSRRSATRHGPSLARAFALDTVEAALASRLVGMVLAVTDDHLLARSLRDIGAQVMPDGVTDDLNGTLVQAAAELARRSPEPAARRPVRGPAGTAARRADRGSRRRARTWTRSRSSPTPTTSARRWSPASTSAGFRPSFGPGSRVAHRSRVRVEVTEELAGRPLPTLRRDVDTPADLEAATALGLGPRTSLTADPARARRLP